MIESATEHALYWDLERMLKKRILNRTLDQEYALCLLGFHTRLIPVKLSFSIYREK